MWIVQGSHHLRSALLAGGLEQRGKELVPKFWRPAIDRLLRMAVGGKSRLARNLRTEGLLALQEIVEEVFSLGHRLEAELVHNAQDVGNVELRAAAR